MMHTLMRVMSHSMTVRSTVKTEIVKLSMITFSKYSTNRFSTTMFTSTFVTTPTNSSCRPEE